MRRPGDKEPARWLEDEEQEDRPETEPEKKPAKERQEDTDADAEDEAGFLGEEPADPEMEKPQWRPERRREELAKALADLPEELRYRFLQALTEHEGDWAFERSRYLYLRLVREQTVETDAGPVIVRERLNLRREHPPRPLPPEKIRTVAEDAVRPEPSRNGIRAELAQTLPERDQIEIVLPDEAVEVIDPIKVEPEDESQTEAAAPETESDAPEAPAAVTPETEVQLAMTEEGELPIQTPPEAPEPPRLTDPDILELVEAVYAEEVTEVREPTPVAAAEKPADPVSQEPPEPAAPLPESETAPADQPVLEKVMAEVAEALDEAHPLPPIGGGSPEWDELQRRRRQTDDEPPLQTERPARSSRPDSAPKVSPTPYAETRLLDWERQHRTPEQRPDARMKRKARKLIRVLARRFGLRLTPDTEAMLLEIVLAPRIIGGRKVYGLSLNREELLGALRELWLHFPEAAPRLPRQ